MPNLGRPSGGCYTCRRRRIKCDETRPHCQNCIKARRDCTGYRTEAEAWTVFRGGTASSRRSSTTATPQSSSTEGRSPDKIQEEKSTFTELSLVQEEPTIVETGLGSQKSIPIELSLTDEDDSASTSRIRHQNNGVLQLPAANYYHNNAPISAPEMEARALLSSDKPSSDPHTALMPIRTHYLDLPTLTKSVYTMSEPNYDYIRLYANVLTPGIFTVVAKQQAWNEVMISGGMAEPALWHCLLACSAFTLATMRGSADTSEYEYHKHKSIKIINKSLARRDQPVSSPTIYAIMHLLGFETAFGGTGGSKEGALIHLEGLKSIIRLRGGFQNLHFTGLVQVLLEDVSVAVESGRPTVFRNYISSLPTPTEQSPLALPRVGSPICVLGTGFFGADTSPFFDLEFRQVLVDLRDSLIFAHHTSDKDAPVTIEEVEQYDYLSISAMYRLASRDPAFSKGIVSVQQQLCQDILLMYTIQQRFGMFNQSHVMQKLSKRLRQVLLSTDRHQKLIEAPAFMLWILFQAAAHTEERTVNEWFLEEAANVVKQMQLNDWADIQPLLATFIYFDDYQGQVLRKVWTQVQRLYLTTE